MSVDLDQQQLAATTTTSPRALVLAGAGSGKTRVLIEHIAWLVETQKVSPTEILAITFTRKAAGEMKTRLQERIGNKAHRITLSTIHAFALEMLHRFGEVIGLKPKNITVYGEWEGDYLLREVAMDMGLIKGKTWKIPKKDIDAMFAHYYQAGAEPAEDHPGHDLFRAFIARCHENNALTYGGLLTGLSLLLPTLAKYLHVRHILVDETQDIDHLQWSIILKMEELFGASVFCVGDIDQSIYEWRGACPKYLVDHQDEYDIYRLESNYRSAVSIVNAANKLIGHNIDRIPKTMRATREGGGKYPTIIYDKVDTEALADILGGMTDSGINNIAVLSRVHFLLEKLDRMMSDKDIPHTYVGRTMALTNSEPFRRFHSFLKLLVNPFDNFSFLLIRDLIGLSREQYGEIRLRAAQEGKSHFQVWLAGNGESNSQHLFVLDLAPLEMAEEISTAFPSLSPESLAFIAKWTEEHKVGISDYLDWLATYDLQDEIQDIEGITLSTIHAAKGLEWPVVIIAGCNEDILPSKQAIRSGEIEAERRLAYVAWTRAKDQLILTVRPGSDVPAQPSRFITESF